MSLRDDQPRRRMRAAAEEHDQQLQQLLHQTYRQLEHAYHCSPEYGRMVERYPALARAIEISRHAELVGGPSSVALPAPATPRPLSSLRPPRRSVPPASLCWERSHGEA